MKDYFPKIPAPQPGRWRMADTAPALRDNLDWPDGTDTMGPENSLAQEHLRHQSLIQSAAQQADRPLPFQSRLEHCFGANFGDARAVFGGPEAEDALGPEHEAATVGDRVVFGDEHPSLECVVHEAAHVLQQTSEGPAGVGGGLVAEEEADAAESAVSRGEPVQIAARASAAVPAFRTRTDRSMYDKGRQKHEERSVDHADSSDPGTYASYHESDGRPTTIHHDHGFMDDGSGTFDASKHEDPTIADYASLVKWIGMLEGAEALRPDLVDGTSAYRHFLFGGGTTRPFDYERYIGGDSSGATALASALEDTRNEAIAWHDAQIGGAPTSPGISSFKLQTDAVSVGSDGRYPYPATENWQKAIGGHSIWMEADVSVEIVPADDQRAAALADAPVVTTPAIGPGSGSPERGESEDSAVPETEVSPVCGPGPLDVVVPSPEPVVESQPPASLTTPPPQEYVRIFTVDLTIHIEDMYNFNPGQQDITSGTPDAENGRFEVTGLGHEFLQTAAVSRHLEFQTSMSPVNTTNPDGTDVSGQPRVSGPPRDSRGRAATR